MRFLFILTIHLLSLVPILAQTATDIDTLGYSDSDNDYNLLLAADYGILGDVRKFIDKGADVNTTTYEGVTPLMFAAQRGHIEVVDFLLSREADLDKKPDDGIDALLAATMFNQLDVVELLIRSGANINTSNHEGVTPLMMACCYDYFLMADLLIYYNASINQQDDKGNTAIHYATYTGNFAMVQLLIDEGADLIAQDHKGFTPLSIAVQKDFNDIAKLLSDYVPKINIQNENGVSPFAFAVYNGNYELAELLLQTGANPNEQITKAVTPYTVARLHHFDSIKTLLRVHGGRRNLYPFVTAWEMGGNLTFNFTDFYTGLNVRLKEGKYKLNVVMGYEIRPFRVRVLNRQPDGTLYQLAERRNIVYGGLQKPFRIGGKNFKDYYINIGLYGGHTFGNYRGLLQNAEQKTLIIPEISYSDETDHSTYFISYRYMDLGLPKISPHIISVGANFKINVQKNRFKEKRIQWLEEENWD